MDNVTIYQWALVILSSIILIAISPLAKSTSDFFKGSRKEKQPGFWLLTSSLVISWLFAKSITNAANLGLSFGMVGGVAYAAYYLSFIVGGIIIYQLRKNGGFKSIHEFLESRFGKGALLVFSVLIAFRLFNEIWSNTIVIGTYFGEQGTGQYYMSILVFTGLTLIYSLKGGMSSSILTDVIQLVFFGILLVVILGIILPKTDGGITTYVQSGNWTLAAGGNLLLVAIIQSFSYPFHDPVMTDRGFISDIATTRKSFIWAGIIGAICIILFSWVGIYGKMQGVQGQAPVEVAKLLGIPMMLLVNFIMITSAASTLDSTFSSFSKLAILDLKLLPESVKLGRITMAVLTLIGTIPVFLNPSILSATTISGTMVIGLAPIFIFWKLKSPKASFYLPVFIGIIWGIMLVFNRVPEGLKMSSGKYADLLSVNIWGTLCVFLAFFVPYLWSKYARRN